MDSDQFISTGEMVERIHRIRRQRLREQGVVSLEAYRTSVRQESRKTILVIDDEAIVRSAFKRIFEKEGFEVIAIADGIELEHHLERSRPALILLDINLPWVDGYELCRLFKQHEEFSTVPIVFVSGNQSDEQVKRGFDAGCDDYIKKPFSIDELKDTVFTLVKINESEKST